MNTKKPKNKLMGLLSQSNQKNMLEEAKKMNMKPGGLKKLGGGKLDMSKKKNRIKI